MNTKDFLRLGIPLGEATRRATGFVSSFILAGGDKTRLEEELKAIIANPSAFVRDDLRGELAKALLNAPPPPRAEPVKYRQWGEGLEHEAVMQMEKACLLPVAVAGALMPDAHVGYGLPIGGVLATENTVIPYAVGVDIACRMKMTVLDVPVRELERHPERLTRAIEAETRFGVGATFKNRRHHEVMDADWDVSLVATGHQRQRQPFRRVRPFHFSRTNPRTGSRNLPGFAFAQRQSGNRRSRMRSLQQARVQPIPGSAERVEAAGLVIFGFPGRSGVLGSDGIDGPLRRCKSLAHPQTRGRKPWRRSAAGPGKPSQLRVERAP